MFIALGELRHRHHSLSRRRLRACVARPLHAVLPCDRVRGWYVEAVRLIYVLYVSRTQESKTQVRRYPSLTCFSL